MNEVVQSAFVVILAWLLKLGAGAIGLQIDETTLYTLAGAIVVYLLSKLGVPTLRALLPFTRKFLG